MIRERASRGRPRPVPPDGEWGVEEELAPRSDGQRNANWPRQGMVPTLSFTPPPVTSSR